MKKTIIIIGGGTVFSSDNEFYKYLKEKEIDPFEKKLFWKDNLIEEIKNNHPNISIFKPSMPNKQKADYKAWKIWFEKYLEFSKGNLILIGHSLGGIFLAKYLSENKLKNVEQLILVSPPFDSQKRGKDMLSFTLDPKNLKNIEKQCEKTIIFHSKDDNIVPIENAYEYKKYLSKAELFEYEDKGHFLIEEFPELEEIVK
ncbi:MAG: alpha/beta hydrolase [Nanobdellota archaeon]